MRFAGVLVVACACSGPAASAPPVDASLIDADPCTLSVPDVQVPGCVLDGLASITFDGSPWTLTGTITQFAGEPMPYTQTSYLLRRGSGYCAFEMSSQPITQPYFDPSMSITDTIAQTSGAGQYPHPYQYYSSLCVRDTDGALVYHSHSQVTMPPADTTIDGVFTH